MLGVISLITVDRSNQLHMDIALQTVDYLSNEKDYIPRVAADEQLAYIESMLSLTQHYGNFQVMSFFDLSIQLSSDSKLAISLYLSFSLPVLLSISYFEVFHCRIRCSVW